MNDDSQPDFHLKGKQLVFLFMASTIVAVVIFLCGVMVGRGVQVGRPTETTMSAAPDEDPTAGLAPVAPPTPVDPPEANADAEPPPPEGEDLPVTGGLDGVEKEPRLTQAKAPALVRPPRRNLEPAPKTQPEGPSAEPPGTGYVVQVLATPKREEADALRDRLKRKGYPAFVTSVNRMFRVRVGKFKERSEAAVVAARLQKEEKFNPWVTR